MSHCIRQWLGAVVVAVSTVTLATASPAATFTTEFTSLVTELHARATALTGTTNKLAKAQLKVINANGLAVTTANDPTLAADLKLIGKVAKALQTTFPTEFTTTVATPPGQLAFGGLCGTVVSNLAREVSADLGEIWTQIDALPPGPKTVAVTKTATAASAAYNVALGLGSLSLKANALATVDTGLVTLEKAVGKANPGGGGTNVMTATVNGVAFSATMPPALYEALFKSFSVNAKNTKLDEIQLTVLNVTGLGSYPLSAGTSYQTTSPAGTWGGDITGTLVITAWDLTAGTASGTFTFTATETNPANSNSLATVTSGTFTRAVIQQF